LRLHKESSGQLLVAVEGLRCDEHAGSSANTPWTSMGIVQRDSPRQLRAWSGSVYVLEGSMLDEPPVSTDDRWPMPPDVLAAFEDGFPTDWKERLATAQCVTYRIMKALAAGDSTTVVEWLSGGGSIDVLDSEVMKRADDKDGNGNTALMLVAAMCHAQLVDVLLERKAQVNVQNSCGHTALIAATDAGDATIVRRLLEARAEMDVRSSEGLTALDYATRQEHLACVRAFREHLVGRRVVLSGTSRADLNGAVGTITGFAPDKDRYYVELGDGGGTKLLKPEHVKLVQLPSPPHVSLERAMLRASNAHRQPLRLNVCVRFALSCVAQRQRRRRR
jgi:hypothetical protein